MNRLIIIGNGFDLAHGFKTSYKDFMTWYLKEILNSLFSDKQEYQDDLVLFRLKYNIDAETHQSIKEKISGNIRFEELVKILNSGEANISFIQRESINPINKYKSFFLSLINNMRLNNWVDIENEYYKQLIKHIKSTDNTEDALNINTSLRIKHLNKEFNNVKLKFEEYLKLVVKDPNVGIIEPLKEIIYDDIKYEDFSDYTLFKKTIFNTNEYIQIKPLMYHFLNFNYTNIIDQYVDMSEDAMNYSKHISKNINHKSTDEFKRKKNFINNIHGSLNQDNNPIIFGYGDELDKHNSKINDYNDNELIKHFKSFMYGKTSNYHNLVNFIQSDLFQVYIFGHSCGLSDRTMFNTIFEHQNCKLIKLFYHKPDSSEDDFTEKYYNISRHFRNNEKMREKILSKELSQPLPQGDWF